MDENVNRFFNHVDAKTNQTELMFSNPEMSEWKDHHYEGKMAIGDEANVPQANSSRNEASCEEIISLKNGRFREEKQTDLVFAKATLSKVRSPTNFEDKAKLNKAKTVQHELQGLRRALNDCPAMEKLRVDIRKIMEDTTKEWLAERKERERKAATKKNEAQGRPSPPPQQPTTNSNHKRSGGDKNSANGSFVTTLLASPGVDDTIKDEDSSIGSSMGTTEDGTAAPDAGSSVELKRRRSSELDSNGGGESNESQLTTKTSVNSGIKHTTTASLTSSDVDTGGATFDWFATSRRFVWRMGAFFRLSGN